MYLVYSTEKKSILCWWMGRPDTFQMPAMLGGQIQVKTWKVGLLSIILD